MRFLCLFLICFAFVATSCGEEEGKSSEIDIELISNSPTVINADITLNPDTDDEKLIVAPWFNLRFRATNNSDTPVSIVTFRLEITAVVDGQIKTVTSKVDPGETDRVILGVVAAGEEYEELEAWYFGKLPTSTNTNNLPRYSVKAYFDGWFNKVEDGKDTGEPDSRFNKVLTFSTQ